MKIKDYKNFNKPIEKLITEGASKLSNEELLAILINTGTKEKNCIEISRDILNSLESFNDLTKLSINDLIKFKGIKEKKAATIIAAISLVRRSLEDYSKKKSFHNADDIYNILRPRILNLNVEHIFILYLNTNLDIIKLEELSSENPNRIVLPIKLIIKNAINLDTDSIIISHNHPTGNVFPSESDIKSTKELANALKLVDIKLLDHIIISRSDFLCLKEMFDFYSK